MRTTTRWMWSSSVNAAAAIFCFIVVLCRAVDDHDHNHDHDHDHDHDHSHGSGSPDGSENYTTRANSTTMASLTEAYIYGTLSVAVVSLLSLAGVMLLPFIKKKTAYNSVMLLFMSLAVGTMTSDAVLHLIPETLGLHGHALVDGHGHAHSSTPGEDKPYLGKLVLLLATLYGLYLVEILAHGLSRICKKTSTVHDASLSAGKQQQGGPHHPAPPKQVKNATAAKSPASAASPSTTRKTTSVSSNKDVEMATFQNGGTGTGTGIGPAAAAEQPWSTTATKTPSAAPAAGHHNYHNRHHHHHHNHHHHHSSPGSAENCDAAPHNTICGLQSIAFVITVSDAMHNFTDGLAIGAAFAKSSAAGLAVSIAVVCHELPHEVGDFAILLNTGLTVKKALILNFVSALTCFAGVYPGIIAGQQESLRQWIFALVAGGFLYVALVHMLREIRDFGQLPRYLSITLQNVGLLMGFVVVLMLAVYEDQLSGAL